MSGSRLPWPSANSAGCTATNLATINEVATIPILPLAAVLYLARNSAMNMSWPILSSFLMGVVHPEERSSASAVVGLIAVARQ